MTEKQFDSLKNFSLRERNHNGESLRRIENVKLISSELMEYLDDLTSEIKNKFRWRKPVCVIHCITSGTHTANSAHPDGLAVDCHFTGLGLYEQIMMASLYPFTGLGFYPYSASSFVHLDVKELTTIRRRMWYRDADGVYVDFRRIGDVFDMLKGRHANCLEDDSD